MMKIIPVTAVFVLALGLLPSARSQERLSPPLVIQRNALAAEPSQPDDSTQFYKIGVQHYDAGMMADLATRQDSIVVVPPNFVIPAGSAMFAPLALPAVTALPPSAAPLGAPAGPGLPVPGGPSIGPAAAPAARNNVLPSGVSRIFVLEGNNSLVIEATPQGRASLLLNTEGNIP